MRAETLTAGDASILYDAGAAPDIANHHFDPAWWERSGALVGHAAGRGQVIFVRSGEHEWALRHYRRGGWMARLNDDAYFWSGLKNTRPWREWKLTAHLHGQGLPVPQPIAARVQRAGSFYRGDLITRRIESARPLADVIASETLPSESWGELGQTLHRFHAAGVRHDDINARNILVDGKNSFHLIDFDKAAIVPPGTWREQNLARFRRSLDKFKANSATFRFGEPEWAALSAGYAAAAP